MTNSEHLIEPGASLFDASKPEARANALATVLKPFAQPRATQRYPMDEAFDKDVMSVEVTLGDWWRALVALGLFDADLAEEYAKAGHSFLSDGFADELRDIAKAVHSVR